MRMGGSVKKQFLAIADVPVLTRTLLQFDSCECMDSTVLVIPKEDIAFCRHRILEPNNFKNKVFLTTGGATRQESVYNGLQFLIEKQMPDTNDIVMVHDGVRPFITQDLIQSCADAAIRFGACVPAVSLTDTIKETQNGKRKIRRTLNRDHLVAVQTPQAFSFSVLTRAFSNALNNQFVATDDASLVENMGHEVHIVEGLKNNIKITTQEDLQFAQYLWKSND